MPKILTEQGPKRIAPRPVPVIWEQLPVTEGIFKDEMTKINLFLLFLGHAKLLL